MLFEIKHRFTGSILFSLDCESLKIALKVAIEKKVDLRGSDLSGSDLSGSDLRGSDLSGSDLRGSDLSWSNLSGSNLSGSNLSGSNLSGSDLSGSDLSGSDLSWSNLSWSNLSGSNLSGSNLRGSNLSWSNLSWSNLSGSDLSGSDLSGSDLSDGSKVSKSERPVIQIGPIGSRKDVLIAFSTDKGIRVRTGCFFGTLEEFTKKVTDTHKKSVHSAEYKAAIAMIRTHMKLWRAKKD